MKNWTVWNPLSIAINRNELDIQHDTQSLRLLYRQPKNTIIVSFEGGWFSYTITISRAFEEKLSMMKKKQQIAPDFEKHAFFIVENSRYMSWLKEESYGLYDQQPNEIVHYAITGSNISCEIVSDLVPTISIEKSGYGT